MSKSNYAKLSTALSTEEVVAAFRAASEALGSRRSGLMKRTRPKDVVFFEPSANERRFSLARSNPTMSLGAEIPGRARLRNSLRSILGIANDALNERPHQQSEFEREWRAANGLEPEPDYLRLSEPMRAYLFVLDTEVSRQVDLCVPYERFAASDANDIIEACVAAIVSADPEAEVHRRR